MQINHRMKSVLKATLITSVALLTISCSILSFGSSDPVALKLPREIDTGTWQIEKLGDTPPLYHINSEAFTNTGYYFTSIQDCRQSHSSSAEVTTRQLLVGLSDIRIAKQRHVEINAQPVLFSELEARLDSQPLRIACYSIKDQSCVTDMVLWGDQSNELPEDELHSFVGTVLQSIVK